MSVLGRILRQPATGTSRLWSWLAGLAPLFLSSAFLGQNPPPAAQNPAPAAPPATAASAMAGASAATDLQPTFKLQVERNLVLVRAVVRDSKGNVVRNLRKEDFQLSDNGKPQVITHFVMEGPAAGAAMPKNAVAEPPQTAPETATAETISAPLRYTALLFDDARGLFEDLAHTRDAADRYLAAALQPGDRAAIVTVSGQAVVDFTDNRAKLREALFRLRPRPTVPRQENACPDILEYQAYEIVHENDAFARDIAAEEVLECHYNGDPRYLGQAQNEAQSEAVRALNFSETETEAELRGLEALIRRMAILPGTRNIVMISPGFITSSSKIQVSEIIERALHSNVIINTYDARGLYAPIPFGDASKRVLMLTRRTDLMGQKAQIELTGLAKANEVLRDVALDTGGVFFHNSNDFDDGFRQVGALPEVSYVLGFSPKSLKYDGRFHSLKIDIATTGHVSLQARRGYYAPKTAPDEAARAQEDIEQAVYSQDEMSELPVEVHMQFFKTSDQDAKLSVLTRLDLRFLPFKKQEGRNLDNLTVVTALFDRDGKYLTANEKKLEFRMRDGTLARYARSGITMKTSFDVKPGTYRVRQVVRDAEGGQLSGLSRTIEIPF